MDTIAFKFKKYLGRAVKFRKAKSFNRAIFYFLETVPISNNVLSFEIVITFFYIEMK